MADSDPSDLFGLRASATSAEVPADQARHAGPLIHDRAAVERVCGELGIGAHQLRKLRYAFYHQALPLAEALRKLPAEQQAHFRSRVRFAALTLRARQASARDGCEKLAFATGSGKALETVVLRAPGGRVTLCISSQTGCAAGCQFCATARLKPAVNLTPGELVDQVSLANQLLHPRGERVRNVVLMGMGEPFHNQAAVERAIQELTAEDSFRYPQRRILLSTVGIPEAMVAFARRFPGVRLALSLHFPEQAQRAEWIPLARRFPLPELMAALREVARIQREPPWIEYLMLRGINDQPEHATRLSALLAGVDARINLIPFNPIDAAGEQTVGAAPPAARGWKRTPRAQRDQFAAILRGAGYFVTIRQSFGGDIDAACGQLSNRLSASAAPS